MIRRHLIIYSAAAAPVQKKKLSLKKPRKQRKQKLKQIIIFKLKPTNISLQVRRHLKKTGKYLNNSQPKKMKIEE